MPARACSSDWHSDASVFAGAVDVQETSMTTTIMTPLQVAEYLQLFTGQGKPKVYSVLRLRRAGKLQGLKVGREWRFTREAVEHFLKTSLEEATV